MKNGYFRLVTDAAGFGLEIKAPSDGGECVRIKEVTDYLTLCNVLCDLSSLKNAIAEEKDTVLHLESGACPAENMRYNLYMADDNMSVTARFFAASSTGKKMAAEEFLHDLTFRQIRFGVQEERIREAFEKEEYCTDIVIAEGKAPEQGKDACIEYFFNTDPKARPTMKEDGSVDFFNLNTINHCQVGDVLAKLTPAVPGEDGMTVLGTRIKPREVKNINFKFGKNIDISEDRLVLTSKVNGHVSLVEGQVFVSDVLAVENVDNSTGNIEYEGSVEVHGNIQSNFSVKAQGNIVVNGLVEGAYLEAGGDIIIAKGMAGMSKGELKAGGNIVAKFFENAKAAADGYITTESILHSHVSAGHEITVGGRRGFITGGHVVAAKQIKVKTLGSSMGASTVVEVGADPGIKQELVQLQKDIAEVAKQIKSIEPIVASYALKRKQGVQFGQEQLQYLATLIKAREKKQQELAELNARLEPLQEILEEQHQAQVVVTGEVFPGTKIVIGDVSMVVQSSMTYCKFVKQRGDVKMVGI
ncbi:MAG: DUF342 domain-containing protein [Lachnospiraceae bacterium]|nr:DUF342 domain-containing protein [Lachnospiraceae bacterium]